ncbi:flagellar assembly protein FliH [Mixta intestinalis]|uniref:Flagellar assembly protein FliH n=1 Tax=Mixta intestinalis TaxID=1615494 RepID=A0A6P1Q4B0_9GAMM|nr:flagellar assembly protein FliH [Mixta intestinalis]QHM73231.1 Flagellar assembly protein FliH [Mixta intestinalis]
MSDSQSASAWRSWQPEDLCAQDDLPDAFLLTEGEPTAEQQQAELQRLRQQAEQRGLAQGQAQGLEEGRKQGYEEGYQQGLQAGLEQGLAEARAQQEKLTAQFATLLTSFQTSLNNLEKVIPSRLVQLALMAARAAVGKSLACDSSLLLEKIQSLMQEEPMFQAPAQLWVSAEEFPLIQAQLNEVLSQQGWELHADETMLPGGCRITSAEGELDATVNGSWQSLCQICREDYVA